MRRLPSLSGVEAFVAVARTGSVKAAAEELSLSSPALSRRLQSLERFIGKPLFERRHHALAMNADGDRLLALVAPAIDQLSDAIETIAGIGGIMRLRLGVLPLFASQQLMPRLPELRAAHPSLHLDIDTGGHATARLGDGIDAAIVLAREIEPALYAKRLDRNEVFAIASNDLSVDGAPLTDPGQLTGVTVFLHRDMPDTYEEWRKAAGLKTIEPAAIDLFDSGQLMLDAAAQGLGVAFMHGSHLSSAQDPRLTRVFDVEVESPYSYWFVCRPRALETRPVKLFHDWLVGAMAA
ncbi:LysR substrate-binding domain-containing protein [Sphingomonas sp. SUN039]|uniref:LysR substrate-binding domain-containing protein n=1 Tax=Sphingomonas sp. SUN039 TaxID=2937787 RepID=UPI002164D704|nr:LysR substrate-binding domain-containing protein [Sphingomonas sp. SUN039]UVO55589.1 LysR substrate-binding domain-containing protein [Sphingomonas sp. SUN039]